MTGFNFLSKFSRFLSLLLFFLLLLRFLFILGARTLDGLSNLKEKEDEVVNKLNCPANEVEPDKVIVHEVDDEGHSLGFVQVEGGNEEESEDRGHHQHTYFEFVLGN